MGDQPRIVEGTCWYRECRLVLCAIQRVLSTGNSQKRIQSGQTDTAENTDHLAMFNRNTLIKNHKKERRRLSSPQRPLAEGGQFCPLEKNLFLGDRRLIFFVARNSDLEIFRTWRFTKLN